MIVTMKTGKAKKHSGKNGAEPIYYTHEVEIRRYIKPLRDCDNNKYLPHNGARKAEREMRRFAIK